MATDVGAAFAVGQAHDQGAEHHRHHHELQQAQEDLAHRCQQVAVEPGDAALGQSACPGVQGKAAENAQPQGEQYLACDGHGGSEAMA